MLIGRKLGKSVLDRCRNRGVRITRLAELCDSSKGYMSDITTGRKVPSVPMLVKIARRLGTRASALLYLAGH